ncbi:putative rhipicephalus family xiv [Operophtera brumata]|uniref:Putative rhipicephalus family xiv n=1 Tax=Operophtera brumata TaxID=104452 RepID=A0A0L7LPH1_OPEBR|nr:putative rhipicephalus family xiv [Operophtera brumata]
MLVYNTLPRLERQCIPDYGRTPFDEQDPEWEETMSPYKDAAVAGRQMFSCASIYSGCPEGQGVLELISTLRDE